jgi:kynurenine formamidase
MDRNEAYTAWLEELAARLEFGPKDRKGTANYIDDAARRRAVEAMKTGRCASLARPLEIRDDPRPGEGLLTVDVSTLEVAATARGVPYVGVVNAGFDITHSGAHGPRQTHLDALNHCGRLGTWYSGFAVDDPDGPALSDLAEHKLFTRGVVADVTAVRGTDWVDPEAPVTGEDIDASLAAAGATFERGDALLLYMGRDRYEAAGNEMDLRSGRPTPGAGADAARWIAEHAVSMLCWDFLDALAPSEPARQVHLLVWAIGLLLVDNCHLRPAVDATKLSGSSVGGLVIAPPAIPRATGCIVAPLFIQ